MGNFGLDSIIDVLHQVLPFPVKYIYKKLFVCFYNLFANLKL